MTRMIVGADIRVSDTPEVREVLGTYLKDNLILDNPEYQNRLRMGKWLGKTPPKLYMYEEDGENIILPYGCFKDLYFTLGCVVDDVIQDYRIPMPFTRIDYGSPIPLYDYQEAAVWELRRARGGILQSKAGSGKTQMALELVRELGTKTLWITHTQDLLNQSKERAAQYFNKNLIGTITAGKVDIGKGITFATVQTLAKLDLARYKYHWQTIIVDECHRVSGSPTVLTMYFKVLSNLSAPLKIGLSATVHRADGMIKATYALLGKVAYTVPDEAIADKVMPVQIRPVETDYTIPDECLGTDGMLSWAKMVTNIAENESRNKLIVEQIIKDRNYSSLILSDRLEHLEILMNMLPPDMQKDAAMITGKMVSKKGKLERGLYIEQMRERKKLYLFASYSLCKEGLDIPCLERLYLATPQKDYAIITQSIGRIARVCEGKRDPVCVDIVDSQDRYLYKAYKKRVTSYKKAGCRQEGS